MKKVFALVLAVAMVLTMFVACKKEEEKSSASEVSQSLVSEPGSSSTDAGYGSYKIANIYGTITGDYWGIVYNGCMAALDELKAAYGVDGYCIAPGNGNDYTQQMELIEAAVLKEVDGIVLSNSNADSIGAFVTDYFNEDNWTPIILIDRSLNSDSDVIVSKLMSPTYEMGQEEAKLAIEVTGGKGNYVALGIGPENQNWVDRSMGAIDYLNENAPEMVSLTGEEPYWMAQVDEVQQLGFCQDTITANPGPMVFICSTEGYTNIAVAAISEVSAERQAEIQVVGFDFSKTGMSLIQNDVLYGAVGQNPYLMGYNAVYAMCDYLRDGEIEMDQIVPYCVVTKNNLETEEVKAYLASMKIDA